MEAFENYTQVHFSLMANQAYIMESLNSPASMQSKVPFAKLSYM